MVSFKRRIYGLPVMRHYRLRRALNALGPPRLMPEGFQFASYSLMFEPSWEAAERRIISSLLPQSAALIDIGANHGFYALLAARTGKRVVAIEPDEGNLAVLRSNIALNQADVEVHAAALSDSNGEGWVYGDGDMASLLQAWQGVGKHFRQRVATVRLDDVMNGRWPGERLLIKVDVEGAEDKVLAGAQATIARDPKPFWLIETYPRLPTGGPCHAFRIVFETMRTAGYEARLASDLERIVSSADVDAWDRDPLKSSNFLFRETAA